MQYGSVAKLNGFFGVSVALSSQIISPADIDCVTIQRPIVYVRDPKALHYMLIKEEHIYQESSEFIAYVSLCRRILLVQRTNLMYSSATILCSSVLGSCQR